MHQTQSETTPATLPTPATTESKRADVCTPAQARWFVWTLTAGIGRPEEIAAMNRLFDAAHKRQPAGDELVKELQQRCQALESMVDTLTELMLYGPQTNAQ